MIGRRSDRGPEALVIPERMLAGALDLAFFGTLVSLLFIPAFFFGYEKSLWPDAVLIGLAYFVYFIGCEGLFQATPGKYLCGLRVFALTGAKPSIVRVTIRNLIRPVDALPILYLLGLLFVGGTQRAQRLGDLVGGTVVRSRVQHINGGRQTQFGYIAGLSVIGTTMVWVASSVLLGLRLSDPVALVLLLCTAGTLILVVTLGDLTRYGVLATLIGLAAMVGVYTSWYERESAFTDERGEIRSKVTREIPLGTPEPEALAILERLGAYTAPSAEREKYDCSFFCDAVKNDERFATGYFSEAFNPGWVCSEGDYVAILIIAHGAVTDVRFESTLGGCL